MLHISPSSLSLRSLLHQEVDFFDSRKQNGEIAAKANEECALVRDAMGIKFGQVCIVASCGKLVILIVVLSLFLVLALS